MPTRADRAEDGIPEHVPVADPDHLSLGQTVSEGLGQALPGFLKTAPAIVPMVLGGGALVFIATGVFLALVLGVVGGLGFLMSLRLGPSAVMATLGGYVFVLLVLSYGFIVVVAALLSPFYVAMYRSHWRAIEQDEQLGVLDGVREGFHLDQMLAITLLVSAQSVGFSLLFVPGLLIDAVTNLTLPAMVIDGLGFWKALGRSVRHFFRAPFWHVGLAFIDFILSAAINSFVPLVGFGVAASLQIHLALHAYRDAFPATDVPSRHPDRAESEAG